MEKKSTTELLFKMNRFVIFIGIILIIILFYILNNNFFSGEMRIANSLPTYPNGNGWNIESKGRFPDDSYYTLVQFTTSDPPSKIIKFYDNYLFSNNWQIETSVSPTDKDYSEVFPYSRTYIRKSMHLNILVKPSIGNVMDALNKPQKDLNTVSFYIN